MISFIVIGKNEGWKLNRCLESILSLRSLNGLNNHEIIYVDSDSTDDSINNVKEFKNVQICKLTGYVNAAVARNIGVSISKGDILFFLDGDMEISSKSFELLFDENNQLQYDFISGDFENNYYSNRESKQCISKELYHKNVEISSEFTTGGLFAITSSCRINGLNQEVVSKSDSIYNSPYDELPI